MPIMRRTTSVVGLGDVILIVCLSGGVRFLSATIGLGDVILNTVARFFFSFICWWQHASMLFVR